MDALVYLVTKRVELFDMREQLAADLFLIGLRKPGNLRNSLFERSDHYGSLAPFPPRGGGAKGPTGLIKPRRIYVFPGTYLALPHPTPIPVIGETNMRQAQKPNIAPQIVTPG